MHEDLSKLLIKECGSSLAIRNHGKRSRWKWRLQQGCSAENNEDVHNHTLICDKILLAQSLTLIQLVFKYELSSCLNASPLCILCLLACSGVYISPEFVLHYISYRFIYTNDNNFDASSVDSTSVNPFHICRLVHLHGM